ncbi:MAG: helix-turn-helix domain-containing protein [Oscillospiraceae bacterium]|nr:helix-turn-helix domain-containing protein [Oscillospiraceae bacterium]
MKTNALRKEKNLQQTMLAQAPAQYGIGKTNQEIVSDCTQNSAAATAPPRKWMSVEEMGNLLGLKKTERYWLVHKNVFETRTMYGKMWVNTASFENWYANQVKYHKVTGEESGQNLKKWSYSVSELSEMLELSDSTIYRLIQTGRIESVMVDFRIRITKEFFESWYAAQDRYQTKEDRAKDLSRFQSSISIPQMALLLGIPLRQTYRILRSQKYRHYFQHVTIDDEPRVTKESFVSFLDSQDKYRLVPFVPMEAAFSIIEPVAINDAAETTPEKTLSAETMGSAHAPAADPQKESDSAKTVPTVNLSKGYGSPKPVLTADPSEEHGLLKPNPTENSRGKHGPRKSDSAAELSKAPVSPKSIHANALSAETAPVEKTSLGMSTAQKPENSKYLSLTEATKISGITRQAISKYSAKGAFPIVKAGGKARIPRAEFNAWLVGSKT